MIVVVDCETSGLDPKLDAIVELAMVTLLQSPADAWQLGQYASSLVAPGRRMHPAAQAQHHLTDEMLRDAPHLTQAFRSVWYQIVNPRMGYETIFAAHNAVFDRGFLAPQIDYLFNDLKKVGLKKPEWLCTMRAAKHLWPDSPGHSNQGLRYYVPGLDREIREHLPGGLAPHRALYDALCTAVMLRRMLALHPPAELMTMHSRPILLKTCNMKAHRGKPWAQVPLDYLQWILRADPPFDEDIRHTAAHYARGGN